MRVVEADETLPLMILFHDSRSHVLALITCTKNFIVNVVSINDVMVSFAPASEGTSKVDPS